MEIGPILFVAVLLIIGLVLIALVRFDSTREFAENKDAARAVRQQALRIERRMQRKRWKVWDKIDEMHSQFIERAAMDERMGRKLPAAATPPTSVGEVSERGEEDFTIPDLNMAYEVFQREDYLTPAHVNRPDGLHPSA